ncbi:DUF6082 family protein [Actinoplanes regularis]|uniref:DUF6082 family protein n=1 Tax=Actinoplanes regularis TaxID=52697 RepID=UPI001178857F|nr:DUF6082 family protein [Actinoplanes regularis]
MHRRRLLIASTVALIVGCTIASPILLLLIKRIEGVDWRDLADIGQTYGVASAIYSALAVAGVAAGLIYQERAYRLARVQSIRTSHRELLARVMDNPQLYAPALGLTALRPTNDLLQQHLMTTSWVGYLYSTYDVGMVREKDLKSETLPFLFASESGRNWWETARQWWLSATDHKNREFGRILDQAYQDAVAAGPATAATSEPDIESRAPAVDRTYLVIGTVAIVVTTWWLRRRGKPRP